MSQSKYTIELRTMLNDPAFKLFDFTYNFYNEEVKTEFEDLFQDYYFYYEIGQETVARFKHQLRNKLNLIAPYYKQLYNTELESQGITFLLNKDLTETFVRDVVSDNESQSSTAYQGNANNEFKESNLDNGNASTSLNNDSLTTVNNTVDNVSNENIVDNIGNNTTKEETTLISKGNIGTTSSAELLQRWRDVLININQMIIEECRELFMEVF